MTHKRSRWHTATSNHNSREYIRNRAVVRNRDEGMCIRCMTVNGTMTPGDECDHLIPISAGGTDDLFNLWLLCKSCHWAKTMRESKGQTTWEPKLDYSTGFTIAEPDWAQIIADRTQRWMDRSV